MAEISVQIAAYNCAEYLEAAVKSVVGQGFDVEILIANDGSTDNTQEIIDQMLEAYSCIRSVGSTENLGAWERMAQLVEETDCKYVMAIGADDVLLDGWLSKAKKYLDDNANLAAVYGKMRHVDEKLNDLGVVQGGVFSRFGQAFLSHLNHGGMLFKTEMVLEAGNYQDTGLGSKSVSVDQSLWYRLAEKYDFHFVDEFMYLYRRHPNQLTAAKNMDKHKHCQDFIRCQVLERNAQILSLIENNKAFEIPEDVSNEALLVLGILAKRSENDPQKILKYARMANRIDPDDYGPYRRKVECQLRLGKYERAAKVIDEMIERFGDVSYIMMVAYTLGASVNQQLGYEEKSAEYLAKSNMYKKNHAHP